MLLGTLIGELRDEDSAAAALAALGDIVLAAEIDAARVAHDESPGEYVSGAVQRFARLASDEDWLALMNAIERAEDPGRAVLARMLRWALARDAAEAAHAAREHGEGGTCGCGGGGSCHAPA
ncbi:hypothetical protein [Rhabdaerophilum calidifontis]|uniref:hypothetical protein n=1 Tax=Rhabdaerophilum calidifontis TaxID=2604328 RepID=UPI00198193D6|nr:hypothetical protein [Rhabdaerophilum calidifontis]